MWKRPYGAPLQQWRTPKSRHFHNLTAIELPANSFVGCAAGGFFKLMVF
jgi:hypothetical protein